MKDFESYKTFIEEFGNHDNFYMLASSPFKDPCFLQWRLELKKAIKRNSCSEIIKLFEKTPNEKYLEFYKNKNPHDYLKNKKNELVTKTFYYDTKWENYFNKIIEEDKYIELFKAIDQMLKEGDFTVSSFEKIPSMWDIKQKFSSSLSSEYVDVCSLLKDLEKFKKALQENKISQKSLMDYAYEFLKDENESIIEETLTKVFPNPSDLLREPFKGKIIDQIKFPNQSKAIKILLKYVGCFNLLSQLSEGQYELFFNSASTDLFNFIQKESPEIFTYQDKNKNFLKFAMNWKELQTVEFVKTNLEALKEVYDENGIPVLFHLADNPTVLKKIIELDSSLLLLKTKDGLTAIELLSALIDNETHDYEMFQKMLTPQPIKTKPNIINIQAPQGMIKNAVNLPMKIKKKTDTPTTEVKHFLRPTKLTMPLKTQPKLPEKKVGISFKKEAPTSLLVKENAPTKQNIEPVKTLNVLKNQGNNPLKRPFLKKATVTDNNQNK